MGGADKQDGRWPPCFKASTKFDALKTYSGVFKNTPE